MNWENNLLLYAKLIEGFPKVEQKGKTMPYTSLNGHMFSFLDKAGKMGLRLAKIERDTFIEKHESSLMEQHGSIMKEYVLVPHSLLENTKKLSAYFQKSYDYVATLKPKPTKRKK